MDKLYALYLKRECNHYYEYGTNTREDLLAVDPSPSVLHQRWNTDVARQVKEEVELKRHESYARHLPKPMDSDKLEVEYNGNTGGGYARVVYTVSIRPLIQFDAELEE